VTRAPLIAAFGLAILVMAAFAYTVYERTTPPPEASAREREKIEGMSATDLFPNAPTAGLIEAAVPSGAAQPAEDPSPLPANAPPPTIESPDLTGAPPSQRWEQFEQLQTQVEQARFQAALAAASAPSTVTGFATAAASSASAAQPFLAPPAAGATDPLASLEQAILGAATSGGALGGSTATSAQQHAKWLAEGGDPQQYHPATRTAPQSPHELTAGAVIPGVMVGGINSDLPGQIMAQVAEHVYDSATGQHLLIPQGSRLVGAYDSQIVRGQRRLLVGWTRVIFPDGSSLNLDRMPGADAAGYAGLADKVNNRTFAVFRDALLLSAFAAGVQLSQPQSSNPAGQYDPQQVAAAALGQQLGQTGAQLIERGANIQPTLEIRPGLRFVVTVTRDIRLPPYSPLPPLS